MFLPVFPILKQPGLKCFETQENVFTGISYLEAARFEMF
jgi:hypothetical protein